MEHLVRLVIAAVKYNAISIVIILLAYLVFGIAFIICNRKG
uniref:Uncharacterized protein n=1 Tax=Siphoviridae sp. ctsf32 TaxID=2827594 RepID=A0A8S5LNU6_9CAUD|nr:MAG TPA: hypothetical protein [Siphoviridae sp. ctsf32]